MSAVRSAAFDGDELAGRQINRAGQNAGRDFSAALEAINVVSLRPNEDAPKRPWWKRIFGA